MANFNLMHSCYYLLTLHAVDLAGSEVIRRKSIAVRLLGSQVRIRIDESKKVYSLMCVLCCVVSGLCDDLITRSEESHRVRVNNCV